jgi:hypothetical protein
MPCHWGDAGLAGFTGRVRFLRRFGYPGRIDADERVWLTFAAIIGTAEVALNGQRLGILAGPGEFDVTTLLRERNELTVEVEAVSDRGGLCGEVALEVRRTAFLKDVAAAWQEDGGVRRLLLRGQVAGTAERPLELYAILGRSTVAYAPVRAGQTFQIVSEPVESGGDQPPVLRVELVDGAVVWYGVEMNAPQPSAGGRG